MHAWARSLEKAGNEKAAERINLLETAGTLDPTNADVLSDFFKLLGSLAAGNDEQAEKARATLREELTKGR